MIGKGKSITHGGAAIDYAIDKDKSSIIDKQFIIGDNGTDIKNEFKIFQELNTRTTNNDISFVLSPEPKDGRELINKDFKEISRSFLKKMKLDQHQSITVKHSDRDHIHLHIIINRISPSGLAYKDSFISKETQKQADNIAIERGLTRASVVKEFNLEMTKAIRSEILHKHKAVAELRPKDFEEYIQLMIANGVEVIPTINKANKLQGFKVKYQNQLFKASEITEKVKIKGKMKEIKPLTLSRMGVSTIHSMHNPKLNIPTKNNRDQSTGI